jgi:hypothetical protein
MNVRKSLPKSIRSSVGSRVCWHVYATLAEAKIAAEIAEYNADIDERAGYDFGFMIPGTIREVHDGHEVCCP